MFVGQIAANAQSPLSYRIVLADFGNDRGRSLTTLVGRQLQNEFGVDVVYLNQPFNANGLEVDDVVKESARAVLRDANADLLIWGVITPTEYGHQARLRMIAAVEPTESAHLEFPDWIVTVSIIRGLHHTVPGLLVYVYSAMAHKYPEGRDPNAWAQVVRAYARAWLQLDNFCAPRNGVRAQALINGAITWPEQQGCMIEHLKFAEAAYSEVLRVALVQNRFKDAYVAITSMAPVLILLAIRRHQVGTLERAASLLTVLYEAPADELRSLGNEAHRNIRELLACAHALLGFWQGDAASLDRAEHYLRDGTDVPEKLDAFTDIALANLRIARATAARDAEELEKALVDFRFVMDLPSRVGLTPPDQLVAWHRYGSALLDLAQITKKLETVKQAIKALTTVKDRLGPHAADEFPANQRALGNARGLSLDLQ